MARSRLWHRAFVLLLASFVWQQACAADDAPVVITRDGLQQSLKESGFLLEEPWLNRNLSFGGQFIALVDQAGRFLRESPDGSNMISRGRLAEKMKTAGELLDAATNPNYVLTVIPSSSSSGFLLRTASGRLLAPVPTNGEDERSPRELVLVPDVCANSSNSNSYDSDSSYVGGRKLHARFSRQLVELARCSRGKNAITDECMLDALPLHDPVAMDGLCSLMTWRLSLTKNAFMEIQPSINPQGQAMSVKPDGLLELASKSTLFTGVHTQFLLSLELEAKKGEEDYDAGSYGDLRVSFLQPDGTTGWGYICDYGWNLLSAQEACRSLGFEDGLPTYDGRFSDVTSPTVFAVSGVRCGEADFDFLRCPFRMVGDASRHLEQRSPLKWGGAGYACRHRDRAGVVCGSRAKIRREKAKRTACDDPTHDQREAVAEIFEVERQVNKIRDDMNNGRHWENYLLPVPMTVSLLTSVMLQSAQYPKSIKLVKPRGGRFNHLSYDYYQPNLLQLAFAITDTFKKSNENMNDIHLEAATIQKYLRKAVKNAYSDVPLENKVLFKIHMKEVQRAADASWDLADDVELSFNRTELVLKELIVALSATNRALNREREEVDHEIQALTNRTHELKEEKANVTVEVMESEKRLEAAREKFFQVAKEAAEQECTDGDRVCDSCVYKKAWKTDKCLTMGTQCLQYTTVCAGQRKKCKRFFGFKIRCDYVCSHHKRVCIKQKPVCTKHEYMDEGRYCSERMPKLCTACSYAEDLRKTVKNVVEQSVKMQTSSAQHSSLKGFRAAFDSRLALVDGLLIDVRSAKLGATEEAAEVAEVNGVRLLGQGYNVTNEVGEGEGRKIWRDASMDSSIGKKVKILLSLLELSQMESDTLEPGPVQLSISGWLTKAADLLEGLKDLETASEVGPELEAEFERLVSEGEEVLGELDREIAARSAQLVKDKKGLFGAETPLEVTRQADGMLSSLGDVIRGGRQREQLGRMIRDHVISILQKDVKKMSLAEVLEFLDEAGKQFHYLRRQWGQLKLFFRGISAVLGRAKESARMSKTYFDRLGIETGAGEAVAAFRENLRENAVEALAYSTYTQSLSKYYVRLLETSGLLARLDEIGVNLQSVPDQQVLSRYKQFILHDANATQWAIRDAVRLEEVSIQRRVADNVRTMMQFIKCRVGFEGVDNDGEARAVSVEIVQSARNDQQNIKQVLESDDEAAKEVIQNDHRRRQLAEMSNSIPPMSGKRGHELKDDGVWGYDDLEMTP